MTLMQERPCRSNDCNLTIMGGCVSANDTFNGRTRTKAWQFDVRLAASIRQIAHKAFEDRVRECNHKGSKQLRYFSIKLKGQSIHFGSKIFTRLLSANHLSVSLVNNRGESWGPS